MVNSNSRQRSFSDINIHHHCDTWTQNSFNNADCFNDPDSVVLSGLCLLSYCARVALSCWVLAPASLSAQQHKCYCDPVSTAQPVAPSLRIGPRRHFHLSSEISGATSSHAELCHISNLIGSCFSVCRKKLAQIQCQDLLIILILDLVKTPVFCGKLSQCYTSVTHFLSRSPNFSKLLLATWVDKLISLMAW